MNTATYERMLHLWPECGKSIEDSRTLLGYNVNAAIDVRIEWIEENYPLLSGRAESELQRLDLPGNLVEYWEDCFYVDYKYPD